MLSLAQITAILAFTGAVVATPLPLEGSDLVQGTVSLDHARRSVHSHNGPLELLKVRAKYSIESSPKLVEAAKRQAKRLSSLKARGLTGSVPIRQSFNFQNEKLIEVQVGSQKLSTTLGLAGADTFVFSNLQPKNQLKGHRFYNVDPAKEKKGYSYGQNFNGGSSPVVGKVYTDTFKIGELSTQVVFAAATNASKSWYEDDGVDGYIGLGFYKYANGIQPERQLTFFDNLKKSLAKPIFATALRFNTTGKFDFGFIDQALVDSPFTYVDGIDDGWGHWACMTDGFSIGPQTQITKRDMKIHLDTATAGVYAQPDIVASYWSRVPGAHFDTDNQGYVYPCNAKNMPLLTFTVKGARQAINGDSLRFSALDDEGKVCWGGLQNIGGGVDFGLFGTPFIENKYIVFDVTKENGTVGFAKMKGY
ncbi:hypothetical protein P3342_007610 [Pyrenophora teres f. teres]|uniref:Peptidase A1 domain-containing protein n=1 Tax=Pyrenophora teres f. teres (strain 0-1) TaxID=861557 RepID=E3S956_PYRTT|nr:hypothetical protein PTT_19551 [Pyrenophora teres f. teres 0-1]KAE8827849.1 hypothetical protein HRS9122_09830 [Pyrenophora teres f. teres]KAE8839456.1 hypothetical protein HRS9139_03839 [Pyrenophora teres f. teres]KAE8845421.1 hypothetical protein PTNB85_03686 [Pyrenophora teres f. teres]KAE8865431.1 hypothetical protein PTNB29_02578 [Pyrenophora teres f. teres]